MSVLDTVLDVLFPSRCLHCRRPGADFCLDCLASSRPAERECAVWIYPLYDYRDPKVRGAVWSLKYGRKKRIARVFAEALYKRMLEELADLGPLQNFREPVLVPIPLARARRRERGFNQAELICRALLRRDGGRNFSLDAALLSRIEDGEHQARIRNRSERLRNIVGAFAAPEPDRAAGRNIILIDDVTTTGATLAEARKVLKRAGAKTVIAFTVAH